MSRPSIERDSRDACFALVGVLGGRPPLVGGAWYRRSTCALLRSRLLLLSSSSGSVDRRSSRSWCLDRCFLATPAIRALVWLPSVSMLPTGNAALAILVMVGIDYPLVYFLFAYWLLYLWGCCDRFRSILAFACCRLWYLFYTDRSQRERIISLKCWNYRLPTASPSSPVQGELSFTLETLMKLWVLFSQDPRMTTTQLTCGDVMDVPRIRVSDN
jgi:hypothetical protein